MAVKTIEEVHRKDDKILSFLSFCETSDNPLGYKFPWSSRGVLLALRNAAKYSKDGQVVDVSSKDLMAVPKPYFIYPGCAFVACPNRDSTSYNKRYNTPEFIKVLVDIGFLGDAFRQVLWSFIAYKEATKAVVGAALSRPPSSPMRRSSPPKEKQRILNGLRWIGIFSDQQITPRGNPLHTLCATLKGRCTSRRGYPALAKLVGVPCGVAVKLVLNGTIAERRRPRAHGLKINDHIMKELMDKYGFYLIEKALS
ncbi:saccharopine dehydrogenase [Colletotrichum incanum]|nr:saccharopine dehydrogenase [Colletotrichum incanum]